MPASLIGNIALCSSALARQQLLQVDRKTARREAFHSGTYYRHNPLVSPIHRNTGEISAIARAAVLLKEFRRSEGTLSPAGLVRRTGLPKSTVHRLLQEMDRVGLLERVGSEYGLGLLLFELGQIAPRQRSLHEAARPYMVPLHEATGHNVGLSVLLGSDVVYVEMFKGKDGPRLPQRVGGRWPAHASCMGKAILAFCDPDQVKAVVEAGLRPLTERTITDPGEFAAELERVRRRGAAFDRMESFPNVVGVAAPVMGPSNEVVGAVSCSGMPGRINLARVDGAVRTTALAISRDLARAQSIVAPVLGR